MNGFVARRAADAGAFVSANAPIVDVVDITQVRLVVNVIEKDLKQIGVGNSARVEVDAFPGESFEGRIARISPVLDPATRTASIEIEIPNGQFRLKPGMYARVGIVTDSHPNALVVPTNALVDVNGTRGVYLSVNNVAAFRPVKTGIEGAMRTEILNGVADGDRVVTIGAAGLRNGDPIVLAGGQRGGAADGRGGRGGRGQNRAPEAGQNSASPGPRGSGFETRTPGAGAADSKPGAGIPPQGDGQRGGLGRRGGANGEGNGTGRRGGFGGERERRPAGATQTGPETR